MHNTYKSNFRWMTGEHIIEGIGKCRIIIRDGQVVEVHEPLIRECPLTKRFAYPIDKITPESVKKNIEHRISSFGMFTSERQIFSEDSFVGFGASEMLGNALAKGIIDAAVIACDGVGTVVVTDPAMIQGIGGRMSGLVSTKPIPEVIKKVQEGGGFVPDPNHASMDPLLGIRAAHNAGFHRLAVTVAGADVAELVRKTDPDAVIVVVHTTGTTEDEAERLLQVADLITSCASKAIREICGPKALLQAGSAIPVFAMTTKGKDIIIERMRVITNPLYVSHANLPVRGENDPNPLI